MNGTKTAVYCRLACADTDRLAEQEQRLLSFAERNGYNDCVIFHANGESGNELERPSMRELFTAIREGIINTVIVSDLSRVVRSYIYFEDWLIFLKENRVELISISDKMRFDRNGRRWNLPAYL
jgi:DNA invertase Pin-like site-specific DNA recombinase